MPKADTPDVDERLTSLEVDVRALKDRLTAIAQAIGSLQFGGQTSAFPLPASTFPGQSILFPFGFLRLFACFPSPQTYKIKGTCGKSTAKIPIPGPGNYILTVNVPDDSDCAVEINDLEGLTSVVVLPGNSQGIPYSSTLTSMLIARCQGEGGDCIAELTLTQVS